MCEEMIALIGENNGDVLERCLWKWQLLFMEVYWYNSLLTFVIGMQMCDSFDIVICWHFLRRVIWPRLHVSYFYLPSQSPYLLPKQNLLISFTTGSCFTTPYTATSVRQHSNVQQSTQQCYLFHSFCVPQLCSLALHLCHLSPTVRVIMCLPSTEWAAIPT